MFKPDGRWSKFCLQQRRHINIHWERLFFLVYLHCLESFWLSLFYCCSHHCSHRCGHSWRHWARNFSCGSKGGNENETKKNTACYNRLSVRSAFVCSKSGTKQMD